MGFSRPIGAGWLSLHRSNEDVYRLQMADASAIVAPLHSLYAAGLPAGEGVCPPIATGRGFLGCPTSPHKQAGEENEEKQGRSGETRRARDRVRPQGRNARDRGEGEGVGV